jgi:hypothetical protein
MVYFKGFLRFVVYLFKPDERSRGIEAVGDPRFADLAPAQVVAILAEKRIVVGSESTFKRIIREDDLFRHRDRARQPYQPRPIPLLEARGIHQVLVWDVTHLTGPGNGQFFYLYMMMNGVVASLERRCMSGKVLNLPEISSSGFAETKE